MAIYEALRNALEQPNSLILEIEQHFRGFIANQCHSS